MTKWQIFVEYVLKNKVIWLLCFSNIFLYVVRIGIDQWSTVYAFQELKLSKEVAIQGFTLFEVGALVGTLLWGWLSDLANGRRALVACVALALIIATPRRLPARQQPVCLSGLAVRARFPGVWAAAINWRGGSRFSYRKKPSALRTVSREPSLILSAIALPSWVWA
ncbi:hexosephosphate transport protein [Salmonella enterica subsp. arizonae]|uniref:Hexosephosphate transport protein n=1 Tax=Salmonella enterica subsp. arizonae TaxID=59203 RepID=A0A379T3Y4_SALER|nr:hexosephosphate transport protein [Salmonella enterica subsp. arizonae]